MSKYQARLYFLYPFLLAIFVYFFNVLFNLELDINKTFFFFFVVFLSGVISFTHERKNTLSEIIAIGGSVIIFSLVLVISKSAIVGFVSITIAIFISALYHAAMFIVFSVIYEFFEWIFDAKKSETMVSES